MIKKIIYFSIIFVSFCLVPRLSFAQAYCDMSYVPGHYDECCGTQTLYDSNPVCSQYNPIGAQCMAINVQNYSLCCPSDISTTARACSNFHAIACATDPNGIICNPIRGGSQNTNPTNGGTDTSNTIAPTPKASSSALASCNLISFDSLLDILIWLKCVIGAAIIPLVFTTAFLIFLWGMVNYIRNSDNEKKREESKKFIYYGIIGLTVMVAVWGIVRIVTSTFGLGNTVPQLQTDCLTTNKNNPCKN